MGATATFSLTRALRWARGSALLFTLAVMAVTMTLAVAVNELRDETDQRRTAQLLLRELEADAAELQIAEVAAADGDPTALVEFAHERANMWRTFIALAELVSTDQVAVDIRTSLNELDSALADQLALANTGWTALARIVDERRVDPSYREFDERAEAASLAYAAEAARFARTSHYGLLLCVLAACSAIGGLAWRYARARRRSDEQLAASRERFRTLAESSFEGVAVVRHGRVVDASDALASIVGHPVERLLGSRAVEMFAPESQKQARRSMAVAMGRSIEASVLRPGGERVALEVRTRSTTYLGEPALVLAVRDIGERKALEERLQHQALHDPLTGVANRTLFTDRLQHALQRRHPTTPKPLAVLFCDLDDFKVVNDSFGHAAGDRMLVTTAERISSCLRLEDTVARFGGDEFAVLLENVADEAEAATMARRILDRLASEPALLQDGRRVYTTASIGIALGKPSVDDPSTVLRAADLAMYGAKATGKGSWTTFRLGMEQRASDRLMLEIDLRGALERGEFEVQFQPQVDLEQGHVVGVEALLRWHHPKRGVILPSEFIPIAEQSGQIVDIGRWVLETTCTHVGTWRGTCAAAADLLVTVNVSAGQLNHPDLPAHVAAALRASGLPAERLVLEITETALLMDSPLVSTTLAGLRALGVKLAIDDFGTGYSSMTMLKWIGPDYLKVDKSFVDGLSHSDEDDGIVEAIIGLARSVGAGCIAEGVEDEVQRDKLVQFGCELGQGFLFHRPLSARIVWALLASSDSPRPRRPVLA